MSDGDAKRFQNQIDQLRGEVQAAQRAARFALTQAETARWCHTQITHVLLDLLTKRDVLTKVEIQSHLEATIAGIKPHLKQNGMRELAKELQLLAGKMGRVSGTQSEPSPEHPAIN